VRSNGPEAVTRPGSTVGKPRQALDAGTAQHRAEQLGLGLAVRDLDHDPLVRATHRY
jgi:hypothetical protein